MYEYELKPSASLQNEIDELTRRAIESMRLSQLATFKIEIKQNDGEFETEVKVTRIHAYRQKSKVKLEAL